MSSELREKLQPIGDVILFLIYEDGCVFIEKRLKEDSRFYKYWIIPGGRVESSDRSFEDAASREAKEEKDIKAKDLIYLGSFIDRSFSDNDGNLKNNHAYLITDFEGEPKEQEPLKAELMKVAINDAENYLEIASSKLVLLWAKTLLQK